jgi:hypothetical protein
MNFFCRLFGHTWVMKTEDVKIRWTTDAKTLSTLDLTSAGEPRFFWECARCKDRRYIESRDYKRSRPGEGRPEPAPSA